MKVMIFADYPGTCGVRGVQDGVGNQIVEIGRTAKIMQLNEVNACIDGLRDAGVDEILVWDNCPGDPEKNPFNAYGVRAGVFYATSRDFAGPVARVDASFDAAIHLGAYAMNHTPGGFMACTVNDKIYDYVKINGALIGDIGLNILRQAYFGVPTVLVSGDDKACKEAIDFNGKPLETVITKKGLSLHKSMNYSAPVVCAELRQKSAAAIRNLSSFHVKNMQGPYTAEIRMLSPNFLSVWVHMGYELKDDNIIVIQSDDLLDLIAQINEWAPGAHAKCYGITAATCDFFSPVTLD